MKAITALLDMVPGWIYAIIIAALLATGAGQAMRIADLKGDVKAAKLETVEARLETAKVELEFSKFRGAAEKQRADDLETRRKQDLALQSEANRLRGAKDVQINRLRDDVRDLRYGLRHLPTRLSAGTPGGGVSPPAGGEAAGQVCDGGFIYGEAAEDLAAEADRAETIRLHYIELIDFYERAQAVTTGRP